MTESRTELGQLDQTRRKLERERGVYCKLMDKHDQSMDLIHCFWWLDVIVCYSVAERVGCRSLMNQRQMPLRSPMQSHALKSPRIAGFNTFYYRDTTAILYIVYHYSIVFYRIYHYTDFPYIYHYYVLNM